MRVIFLFFLITLFFLLQYRLWFGFGNYPDNWRLKREIAAQRMKIDDLQKQNRALMKEINAWKNDPNATEALARRRLGMIKKGETFYQVIELPETASSH